MPDNDFIGSGFNALNDTEDFAGTTAIIVSGAMVECCKFEAYLIYSSVLTAFIYPMVSHWIWAR